MPVTSTKSIYHKRSINKKHLKNVGPICHCKPPHAHSPGVATLARPHRCPRRRRQQRRHVTEGTAIAPQNGLNKEGHLKCLKIPVRQKMHLMKTLANNTKKKEIHQTTSSAPMTSCTWYGVPSRATRGNLRWRSSYAKQAHRYTHTVTQREKWMQHLSFFAYYTT